MVPLPRYIFTLIGCTNNEANIISLNPIASIMDSVLLYSQIGFNDGQSVASAHTEKNKDLIAPYPRLKYLPILQSAE